MNTLKDQVEILVNQRQFASAFDIVLQEYCQAEVNDHQRDNIKKLLLRVVLSSSGEYPWEDLIQIKNIHEEFWEMLKNENSIQTKEFVAACLLRLLSIPSTNWIDEGRWRPQVIEFLKEALGSAVLEKDWRIDVKDMGHIVIQRLRESVQENVRTYEQWSDGPSRLEQLRERINRLRTVINKPGGKAVFAPFLPTKLNDELTELSTRMQAYENQHDSWNVLDAYENAKQQINTFAKNSVN